MLSCHGRLRASRKPFNQKEGASPKRTRFQVLNSIERQGGMQDIPANVHTKHSGLRRSCRMCSTALKSVHTLCAGCTTLLGFLLRLRLRLRLQLCLQLCLAGGGCAEPAVSTNSSSGGGYSSKCIASNISSQPSASLLLVCKTPVPALRRASRISCRMCITALRSVHTLCAGCATLLGCLLRLRLRLRLCLRLCAAGGGCAEPAVSTSSSSGGG